MSASELLRDPFLQTDGLAGASLGFSFVSFHKEAEAEAKAKPKPTEGEEDRDGHRERLLPSGSMPVNAISSSSYEEAPMDEYSCWDWDWDRDRDRDRDNDENAHIEEAHRGIDLFHGQEEEEEEPIANLDISIKGKRKDDGAIFLRLRISDIDGIYLIASRLSLHSFSTCFLFLSDKACGCRETLNLCIYGISLFP